MEVTEIDEHASLLQTGMNCICEKFFSAEPGVLEFHPLKEKVSGFIEIRCLSLAAHHSSACSL